MCWTCKFFGKEKTEQGLCVTCQLDKPKEIIEKNLQSKIEELDGCYRPNEFMTTFDKIENNINNFLNVLNNGIDQT